MRIAQADHAGRVGGQQLFPCRAEIVRFIDQHHAQRHRQRHGTQGQPFADVSGIQAQATTLLHHRIEHATPDELRGRDERRGFQLRCAQ